MRVGEVTGCIDLMGLDVAEELYDNLDVGFAEFTLLDASGLVEREVEEVGVGLVIEPE